MRWNFGVEPLPRVSRLRVAGAEGDRSRALARGAARRARAPHRRAARRRGGARAPRPGSPAPRVGANAASDGRVYLDHSRDIGAFNPCFPTYEIRVDGDRASGTVTLPDRLRRSAGARPRRLPRRVLRLGHPAPQLRRRGRRQDDLAHGHLSAADPAPHRAAVRGGALGRGAQDRLDRAAGGGRRRALRGADERGRRETWPACPRSRRAGSMRDGWLVEPIRKQGPSLARRPSISTQAISRTSLKARE